MAGQYLPNFFLPDNLQYNTGLTPPAVPGCSYENPASRGDWPQYVTQEAMAQAMQNLIFPTPNTSTFEDNTMMNRDTYAQGVAEEDVYGPANYRIEDNEIFASTSQIDDMIVSLGNHENYNSSSMFQHLEEQMKKCMLLDEKLKLREQETMNPKHSQKIIELSYFPLLDFLSTIINLRGLKKGESELSVLDYSENLNYILEKLYLKMKIISQFQAAVAACNELKESEKSEELEPDPFGYFVPASCSKKNMEVYLTDENIKKTKELVCSLISAFKAVMWLYDEKSGYHPKSSCKSLSKQSEEDLLSSEEEFELSSSGEESAQSSEEETVQSSEEETVQSPDQTELLPEDQPGPSSAYQFSPYQEDQPGPSSAYQFSPYQEDQPGPSSAYQFSPYQEDQPGPSSAYQFSPYQEDQPGPSSAYQFSPYQEDQPGPSSAYQFSPYQNQPGPSSAYQFSPYQEDQAGPSSAYQFGLTSDLDAFSALYMSGATLQYPFGPFSKYQTEKAAEYQAESSTEYQPESSGEYQPEAPGEYHTEAPGEYQPEASGEYHTEAPGEYHTEAPGEYHTEAPGEYQPEASGEYQPEASSEYQPEASGEYQPEASGEYQPEASGEYQPEASDEYQHEEYQSESSPERQGGSSSGEEADDSSDSLEIVYEAGFEDTQNASGPGEVPIETAEEVIGDASDPCEVPVETEEEEIAESSDLCEVPVETEEEEIAESSDLCEVPVETEEEEIAESSDLFEVPIETEEEEIAESSDLCEVPVETEEEDSDNASDSCEIEDETAVEETENAADTCEVLDETEEEDTGDASDPCEVQDQAVEDTDEASDPCEVAMKGRITFEETGEASDPCKVAMKGRITFEENDEVSDPCKVAVKGRITLGDSDDSSDSLKIVYEEGFEVSEDSSDSLEVVYEAGFEATSDDPPKSCDEPKEIPIEDAIITVETSEPCNTSEEVQVEEADSPFQTSSILEALMEEDSSNDSSTSPPQQSEETSEISPKEPRELSDGCDFSEVKDLLFKFTKHALRALTVFSDPDIEYCFTEEVLSNEVVAAKNLAIMYIIGPQSRIEAVFPNILPVIFECLHKSSIVKVFTNRLLGHRRTSDLFSKALLKHFSNISLEVMADDKTSSKQANITVALFADMLKSFTFFPDNIGKYHSEYLDKNIKSCIKLIPTAPQPMYFFRILKIVYSALFRNYQNIQNCCDHLCSMLSYVFEAFDIWLQRPVEHKIWIMILDTVLSISKSVSEKSLPFLLPYLETVCKCITFCIKENAEICLKALRVFEKILEIDPINLSTLPVKDNLLHALYIALKRPERSINDKVFTILGKLGSYNRDNFKYAHELEETKYSSLHLVLLFENRNGDVANSIEFSLTKLPVDVAYDIITNPDEDIQRKKTCWSFVKEFLKVKMKIAEQCFTNPIVAASEDQFWIIHRRALSIMFIAADIACLSEDAKPFKDKLILTYIIYSCIDIKDDRNHFFLVLLEAAFETISSVLSDNKEDVHISPLTSIISLLQMLPYGKIYDYPFFQHVVTNAIELCYKENWEGKYAGCKTIRYILEITDLEWKMEHMWSFIKPLLYSFADSNGKLSFGTSKESINTLEYMIKFVSESVTCSNSDATTTLLQKFSYSLIEALLSCDYCVRKEVRSLLNNLVEACNTNLHHVVKFTFGIKPFHEAVFVVRFYEDFEFNNILMHKLVSCNRTRHKKKLYDDLKSLCNDLPDTTPLWTPTSKISDDVNMFCGALNALCFNFINEITIKELFGICICALRSSIDEISQNASKCLKKIIKEFQDPDDIIIELVTEWVSNLFELLYSNPDKNVLKEFLYFRQIIPNWREKALLNIICEILQMFLNLKASLLKSLHQKEQDLDVIDDHSEKLYFIIEIMNTLTFWKCIEEEGKISIIREVLSFVDDLRPYRKLIPISRLQDPILKFCRLHHFQALVLEFHKNEPSFMFEELMNFKNDSYAGSLYYETLLEESNSNEFLRILQHISKHTPTWFEKKDITLAKYLLKFHQNRYYAYISSETESSLKTFLFIKESKILVKCLTLIYMYRPKKVNILFELMTVFAFPFASQFQTLQDYVLNTVAKTFTASFFEKCFLRFTDLFTNKQHQALAEILQYIIIPSFFYAVRKGNCEHFFVSNNDPNSDMSVLDSFYACLWDLTEHTSRTQSAFMKLAVLFAEQMHQMSEDTREFFIREIKDVLKSLNNSSSNCLLLATLTLNNACLENESKDQTLRDCFDSFMKIVHDEEFVLEKFFYLYATKLPLNFVYEFCDRIIAHYPKYIDRILNLVFGFEKEFCGVAHIFIRYYMDFEFECFFLDDQHINKVLRLLDIIMYPGRETIHSEFDDKEISWIVNILLQHLSSQKISDKCYSLLKRILEGKIISNQGIYFDASLTSHLINIAEHPEIYEKCEIFKLMSEVLDYLPLHIVESFVNNLHRCFSYYIYIGAEITPNHIKVLEHMSNFLAKLTEKYPPETNESEELEALYNIIRQLSVSDVTLQKAIVLEAVKPCFYLSTMKEYIVPHIGKMFDYYFIETVDISLRVKSLTVFLKILKKDEVFFEITEKDKRLLLATFFPVIDADLYAEILLEIVCIMDLIVKLLKNERKISQRKKRRKISPAFVYEVFAVLGKISSKVDSYFPNNEEINAKLFDVLLVFRENYGDLLQGHDLKPDNFEDLQPPFIGFDERLKSQFKGRFLYVPGSFYHSAKREKFFKALAKEIKLDVSGVVRGILENKFYLTISKFYIALCTNLIAMKVKQVLVIPEENFVEKGYSYESLDLFSSLVQLCFEDSFLAEHIWMQLFPAVLKMLENTGNTKDILDSDDVKAYINKISSNEYNIVPIPSDVLINGAVKAIPEICLHVDQKSIQRSYSLQVLISQLLEKHLFQNCSSKNSEDYIKILNEIYSHMEESDLYYCFNQNYVSHESETKSAMTLMQDNHLCRSLGLFKKLLTKDTGEDDSKKLRSSEKMFCKNEFIKCSIELSKWNFFSHITSSMYLRDINIFAKWNIEEGSPTSTLKLQDNFSKSSRIDDSWKDRAISKCMETLKAFPNFYNRRYYSLLELVQEINELVEAWSVQNNFNYRNMLETSRTIEDVYSKWKERRYLPSDDYQFLTETFRIRLAFLKYFESRYSTKGNDLCIDETSRIAFENISQFAQHEINASLIELCTIALFWRNLHIINLKFDKYSQENVLNLLRLKALSLLQDVGPSSNLKFVIEDKIKDRVVHIAEYCIRYLEPTEHEVIDVHILDTLRRLDQENELHLGPCISSNAKVFELHYEMLEKNCNPRENNLEASCLLSYLLASCKHGDILNSMKLMPKILRILEYEDKDCLFPEALTKYKVPAQYWLPFLPFLISRLLKALNPKYENSRMEVDGDTRPSLSYVLSNLLKEIGKTYPQEIFFAVNSFKKIDPTFERIGFIVDDGEVDSIEWLKSGKEKCEEIIASLKLMHPRLISYLEGFVRDFKMFKPTCHEINLAVIKELFDKVYCSLYKNFEEKNTKKCSPEFTSYIQNELKLLFALLNSSGEENSFYTSNLFSTVDSCSYASLFGVLRELMERFIHLTSIEKKSFYLDLHQPFITNLHHFEEDIYVFGQSSLVKILKFLPIVEPQIFGEHKSYKISVLGHNGKVYPFLLRVERFKEESMKRTKCIEMLKNLNVLLSENVECANRFFNFYFPTMITLDPNMILVPYQQEVLLYQDIMVNKEEARGFSPHLYFTRLLLRDPKAFQNADSIMAFIKQAHKDQSAYTLKRWVETLYLDHMDFYSFKKEFIKHLSMLIASEYFLNIALKNELLLFKKNGIITVFEPRLNLKEIQNFSFMITPNICEFVGPLGLKLIAENVYWITSCFKENMKTIDAYLHLLKKDYYLDKEEKLYDSHEPILEKLNGLKREDISKFIELSASTISSCKLNPMIQPFF